MELELMRSSLVIGSLSRFSGTHLVEALHQPYPLIRLTSYIFCFMMPTIRRRLMLNRCDGKLIAFFII